jgi:hypothetical protein
MMMIIIIMVIIVVLAADQIVCIMKERTEDPSNVGRGLVYK